MANIKTIKVNNVTYGLAPEGYATTSDLAGKVNIDQGTQNAGKYLVVDPSGLTAPTELPIYDGEVE